MPYRIYVIELSKRVFTENAKFRNANPQFNGVLQCLYVGMTSKTPKARFTQHKTVYRNKKGHKLSSNIVEKYGLYLRPSLYNHIDQGHKLSSNIVEKYGLYLRPSLYNHIDPITTRAEALKMEETLALELRRQKYAVWFN